MNPDPHVSIANSTLTRRVAELAERLQAGEQVDLKAFCTDSPEQFEQLEMLLPTLQAVFDLENSLAGHSDQVVRGSHDPAHPAISISPPFHGEGSSAASGILGDFRILREVGRGGMGVVYEAEQISLGRRVALKVLPFAAMLDRQQLARFKNEARAAATLKHPNIVSVYSIGCERGVHFFAMELIEGQSLAQVVEQMRSGECGVGSEESKRDTAPNAALPTLRTPHSELPTPTSQLPAFSSREYFRTIAQLGIQAAEALDHAHQNGVLLRDIKPANLLVESNFKTPSPFGGGPGRGCIDASHLKLWITDFGLARIEQDAGMTMTGDLLGTLRYMSPEQALAKRVVVDHRSDIYSLGVTLYELLTLQPAYTATDRQELLRQIAFEEPRKLRQVNTRIPHDLETVILKSIEKNPTDRYATAKDFADDLRRLVANEPIKAKSPSLLSRVAKWSRRHRSAATAASIVAILLLMFTTAVIADRWRQKREGNQFVLSSLAAARVALEANDLNQANQRVGEAQSRIDAYRLNDRELLHDVEELELECNRFAKLEQLLRKTRDQRGQEQLFADEALTMYHVMDSRDWLPMLRATGLPEKHVTRIVETIYELILAKADYLTRWPEHRSPENTRLAVKYLEQAVAFHATSRGYYWLLANCAHMEGDREKEAQLRATALATPVHHAAELFYINRDREWGWVATKEGYPIEASYKDHREMLRFDPSYYNGLFFMAMRLGAAGRHSESLGVWYACLALQPGDWVALQNRGLAFLELRHYDEAIADFHEAIRLMKAKAKTQQPNVYLNLGNALDRSAQHDEAIASYREAIRLDPKYADAYNNLGSVLRVLGRTEEAISAYREAIRLQPNSDASFHRHHFLADILKTQGKINETIVELREAARIKPDDALVRIRVGWVLKEKGLFDEAIAEFREAIRLNPDEAAAHKQLAIALESTGLIDEAIAESRVAASAYRKRLIQKPDDPLAQADLAWLLTTSLDSDLRDAPEALDLAKKAVKGESLNIAVWNTLGVAHYRMGNWQDAIEALRKSTEVSLGGDSYDWFFLAMAEWQLGNRDVARVWQVKAVEWQEKNRPEDAKLIRFRKEAEELLGAVEPRKLDDKSTTTDTPENVNPNPNP